MGITSYGPADKTCAQDIPAVYTKVVHYLDWIAAAQPAKVP